MVAFFVSFVFFVFGIIEKKFIFKNEPLDMKKLLKNSILCYFSTIAGIKLSQQFVETSNQTSAPGVFIDKPGF